MKTGPLDVLRSAARRVRHLSGPTGLVLLYHRIAEPGEDHFNLCVTPGHFSEHLEVLNKAAKVVRLRDVFESSAPAPRLRVAITFDDGYRDNLLVGRRLLEKADAPATLFAVAGDVGEQFWWDELEDILFQPESLPASLTITGAPTSGVARRDVYFAVHRILQDMPAARRADALEQLKVQVHASGPPRRLRLSEEELRAVPEGGLIDIGAHSMTHPVLSRLSVDGQREEILGCKRRLEELLGSRVTTFAYPFGSSSDFNKDTVALVKEAGFESAFMVASDAIWRSTDRFRAARVMVTDCDGHAFERSLRRLTLS